MANDLRRLAMILVENELVKDAEPLTTAASACQMEPSSTTWEYDFTGLTFNSISLVGSKQIRHTHPQTVEEVEVQLHVLIKGHCVQVDNLHDPLKELVVELEIKGYDSNAAEHFSAWHLDRQIESDDPNQVDHAIHPIYHFQYGGERVWNKNTPDYGLQLLLETPRFPHPPMDAILAVDFVLSNYYGDIWNELRKDEAYRDIIATAQHIYWRPYSLATASHWGGALAYTTPYVWPPKSIWPNV
ncbi:hypothetical protein SAMN02746009_03518 [Hymenobacter psychrotolerans DSM 18569]|uniref:Uncharacterized protein n=2 Tax=Hymenobacter psychrotolerans TaxID=344998 RepID=A0A1M7E502_9BACT|nr:hypothetical protein SAMN02746009_03518 [Hymenobacter psychrotolerans DSM 18569]